MRIALAQINMTVGDIEGNLRAMQDFVRRAKEAGADLVAFPELSVPGYPPEDLLLKPNFVAENREALESLAASVSGIGVIAGFADRQGKKVYNAAAYIAEGRVQAVYHKNLLPNYGVFDEKRYFSPGKEPLVVAVDGIPVGLSICEDIWFEEGPVRRECQAGAKLVIVINASPYYAGRVREREKAIQRQAQANNAYIAYVNLIGGQDELVFDGYSMIVDPAGKIIAHAEGFQEDLLVVDLPLGSGKKVLPPLVTRKVGLREDGEEVYQALVLGLRDYVHKNSFQSVVVGLSGGIDSAIVAVLAADALGRDQVHGVFMPTRYSSPESRDDAQALAQNLGIDFKTVPIDGLFAAYLDVLAPLFAGKRPDITEENLQARIRGNIMMALSNKFGWLVLTTGNKSEMSTGYATLYGDMAGGFAVIKDVPKTLVYALSRYRNARSPVIPQRIIDKEPTAELRPNQKDSDSLPPYPVLDPILKLYVEEDKSVAEIIAAGFPREVVKRAVNLVDKSEYKRRQSPPGIKITPKAFGRDRRMPVTNRYVPNIPQEAR